MNGGGGSDNGSGSGRIRTGGAADPMILEDIFFDSLDPSGLPPIQGTHGARSTANQAGSSSRPGNTIPGFNSSRPEQGGAINPERGFIGGIPVIREDEREEIRGEEVLALLQIQERYRGNVRVETDRPVNTSPRSVQGSFNSEAMGSAGSSMSLNSNEESRSLQMSSGGTVPGIFRGTGTSGSQDGNSPVVNVSLREFLAPVDGLPFTPSSDVASMNPGSFAGSETMSHSIPEATAYRDHVRGGGKQCDEETIDHPALTETMLRFGAPGSSMESMELQ
ncbi:unnamed protein product [Allacma fusca]|uniref:Uncharacterized protein n=1 Tax=Allacma fusca TaxID=39272 RepID=A0A8J2P1T7_9HEXA|nr:unnamed protein product [Allacma fusca]